MKITRIGNNAVEVIRPSVVKDVETGEDVTVYEEKNKVVYGMKRAEAELAAIVTQKEELQKPDFIQKRLAELTTLEEDATQIIEALLDDLEDEIRDKINLK